VGKVKRILIISPDTNLQEVLRFCFDGWGYEVFLWDFYREDINTVKKISPDVIVVDIDPARQVGLKTCNLLKEDFITAFIPIIALINKRHLRAQLLNLKHGVDDYMIKPPDPLDLRVRIEMAIKRSHYSFYSSSLTALPGARIIEETVKDKLHHNLLFSFAYIDIDNFKSFNDVYGYIKGDKVIMQTAYMLYDTVKKFGNPDDFIGHIGGDDFVFITSLDKYRKLCQTFIHMFDNIIPFHYSSSDRDRGFIVTSDRTHKIKRIPLMSVSVAVVNIDNNAKFRSIVDINERIAEIKKYLKTIPGSKFMVDRRNTKKKESLKPSVYRKEKKFYEFYKPLGQILLERNTLSEEQLDQALGIHWERGVIFGEILKELGFIKEEELTEALKIQKAIMSGLPKF
jgi:GGDEF domain-containing protein